MGRKYAFLLLFMIVGALVVSYGFKRIDNQQSVQNDLISVRETQAAACRAANVLRANTNVNSYAEYRAWRLIAREPSSISTIAKKALVGVLAQTWIPLTDCAHAPRHEREGYPIPTAVRFSVQVPPSSALHVSR